MLNILKQGLTNLRFEVKNVTSLEVIDHYQLITAFDAIDDQVYLDRVLKEIAKYDGYIEKFAGYAGLAVKVRTGIAND